jgi:hypothetical protein
MVRNYGFLPVFYEASGKPRPATVRTKDHVESNSAPCYVLTRIPAAYPHMHYERGTPGSLAAGD